MNPETNKFEELSEHENKELLKNRLDELCQEKIAFDAGLDRNKLVRADGSPVPKHWSIFKVGELVEIKNYTFKVVYIGESNILFEPAGPVIIGNEIKK
jgi:hypothetical protein